MARPDHRRSDGSSPSPSRGAGDSRRDDTPPGGFRTRRERRAAETGSTGQTSPFRPVPAPESTTGGRVADAVVRDPSESALPAPPGRAGVTVSRPPDGLVRRAVPSEPFARADAPRPEAPRPAAPLGRVGRDYVEATGPVAAPARNGFPSGGPVVGPPPGASDGADDAGAPTPLGPGPDIAFDGASRLTAAAAAAAPVQAAAEPAQGSRSLGQRLLRDAREVLGTVAVALGIAIVIKTFLVQPFFIPSQSMESTLEVNDRVLVSKLEPGPLHLNRGDVVVFVDPGGWLPPPTSEPSLVNRSLTFVGLLPANSGEHLIKRVIGLPQDTVRCCDPDGRILVNNEPLDEEVYLFPGDSPSTVEFEVTVPQGTIWVMGDHRSVSEDSRYHGEGDDLTAGAVPVDNVVGRAVLVMWPLSRWDWLGEPEGVFDGVGGTYDGVR